MDLRRISTDLKDRPVYTTCEAGKRRLVNDTRALAGLRNLSNAEILLGIAGQSGFWGAS